MQLEERNTILKKLHLVKNSDFVLYDGHSFQFMFPTSVNRSNCSAGQVKGYYSHTKLKTTEVESVNSLNNGEMEKSMEITR